MTGRRWYSPQLSLDIVGRLYRRAKIEHVAMTELANQLLGQALGPNESSKTPIAKENNAEIDAE